MKGRRRRAGFASAAASLSLLVAPSPSHANGAFPSSGQVLVTGEGGVGVRTTYGLVSSLDGGASWWWTCEAAVGYAGVPAETHPQLAVSEGGAVFGGVPGGLARGTLGGCRWDRVASMEGRTVVDVSRGPGSVRAFAAVAPASPGGRGEVWWSDDEAQTWTRTSGLLPLKFRPLTLDAAPSDPTRLYVSGLVEGVPVQGAIARSADGGASWSLRLVDDADASKAPYLGAIDPMDEDTVWVRLDAAPGQLLVSRDAGDSWETVLLLEGFLRAFALSPDGGEVLAGGEVDGLLRAPSDAPTWRPLTTIAARCAQWREDAIDVCGTEALDGFTVGRSIDDGVTFQPLFRQACVLGPVPCAPDTSVAGCAEEWLAVRETIGATGCGEGGATSSATSAAASTAAGSAPTGGEPSGGASQTGAGGSAGEPGGEPGDEEAGREAASGGCDCHSTPAPRSGSLPGAVAAIAALLGAMGRRRERRVVTSTRGEASE